MTLKTLTQEQLAQRKKTAAQIPTRKRMASFRLLATAPDEEDDDDDASSGLDTEARTLQLSFSSEEPVQMYWFKEVLSHADGAADLSRLNDGAPLLFNHNRNDLIGVVEKAWVEDSRGYAVVRFAKTPRGDEMMGLVEDGILVNVSFMYDAADYRIDAPDDDPYDDDAVWTSQRWTAYEISLVTIPADNTVGVGRSFTEQLTPADAQASASPAAPAASPQLQGESMKPQHMRQGRLHNARTDGGDLGGGSAVATPASSQPSADQVRTAEIERISEIVAIGRRHNVKDEDVQRFVREGKPVADFKGWVLDQRSADPQKPVASLGHNAVDLTDKERQRYSLMRAINALLSGNWEKAGFEREVSVAIEKGGHQRQEKNSFFLPSNLPFAPDKEAEIAFRQAMGAVNSRAASYNVGTLTAGGNLVATNLLAENFIEVLRNMSVTAQLGARYLTDLVGNVDIPRQTGQGSVSWVGESTGGTLTNATFDKVTLRPKTVTGITSISRLMLLQSTPAIEMLARMDLLATCALAIDLAALSGTGTGGVPLGIINQPNVGSVVGGTNGANLTFDHIIALKTQPYVYNAPVANMGYAFNAKSVGYMESLKSTTGQYLWSSGGGVGDGTPATIKGERWVRSNQLRSNLTKGTASGICSEMIFGNWMELLIGMWGVMEISANPYADSVYAQGDVLLRVLQTLDVGVRHAQSFSVMSDALTPGF